ncbi:hypothetical protein [Pedobacter punctiformis]|uniref:Uncharacterized protein n=1 Tax=Pedobacter punctiformis TaxID=3004097 RepID=A0ABT4L7S2_9SPHI|nr:hypothetical protein [Pedobacter sp. HCMS5-2]MCZ4243976.1 hypothetical protein [Pedobacter sp. HCMS5-2]
MEFKYISEIIEGVSYTLNVLKRDTERYSALIYQHEGTLNATNERIGNSNDVTTKLKSYFELLRSTNADLGMTPEYSCPWNIMISIIAEQDQWPSDGKLWVVGLESLKKSDLTATIANLENDNVCLYFDREVIKDTKRFVDPIAYLFRANIKGEDKLLVILQFKTHHMGTWGPGVIERDNMVKGREIYILRNDEESVNLLTVICSEAMNLHQNLDTAVKLRLRWVDTPFLILNPQANPQPAHSDFIAFRNNILNGERKEILGLNWNNVSKIDNASLVQNKSSRSGYYVKSNEIDFTAIKRIRGNHKLGMYYFFFGKDRHAFLLNSTCNAFLIENTSVNIIAGTGPQRRRDGPQVINSYIFSDDKLEEVTDICDSHISYMGDLGCKTTALLNPEGCVIEKEMLACLCSADVDSRYHRGWASVDKLSSVKILDAVEVNRRITVAEDLSAESVRARKDYLEAIEVLNNDILPDKEHLPKALEGIKKKELIVGFSDEMSGPIRKIEQQGFRFNVTTPQGEYVVATIGYLGTATQIEVGRAFNKLQSLFDPENSFTRDRVIVFYRNGGQLLAKSAGEGGGFGTADNYNSNSFLK